MRPGCVRERIPLDPTLSGPKVRLILQKLSRVGRLDATAEIPNLKSEKFSFRLQRLATSSGEAGRRQRSAAQIDYSDL